MEDAKIKRINELYKKSKETGLNEEERNEQDLLRREYIDSMKNSLKDAISTRFGRL